MILLFFSYLFLLLGVFIAIRWAFDFWRKPKTITMVLDEMAVHISPHINAGYIRLKPNGGVYSVPLKRKGSKMAYLVLDFDNETHELSGIEFLDLKLMPSNWKEKAHVHHK